MISTYGKVQRLRRIVANHGDTHAPCHDHEAESIVPFHFQSLAMIAQN
jgi:hypothetical protein